MKFKTESLIKISLPCILELLNGRSHLKILLKMHIKSVAFRWGLRFLHINVNHTFECRVPDVGALWKHLPQSPCSNLGCTRSFPVLLLLIASHLCANCTQIHPSAGPSVSLALLCPLNRSLYSVRKDFQSIKHHGLAPVYHSGLVSGPALTLTTFQGTDTGWEVAIGRDLTLGPYKVPMLFRSLGLLHTLPLYQESSLPSSAVEWKMVHVTSSGKHSWGPPGRAACTLLSAPTASQIDLFDFLHLPVCMPQMHSSEYEFLRGLESVLSFLPSIPVPFPVPLIKAIKKTLFTFQNSQILSQLLG